MKRGGTSTLRKRLLAAYDFGGDPAAEELLDQLVLAVQQLHEVQARLTTDGRWRR